MDKKKSKPARQVLLEMDVREVREFPINKLCSVRSACSQYGLEWGRKYSTSVDREERVITVTREF